MTIGKRLRLLRENIGYTLENVGNKIGVSKQTLYKYESNIVSNIPSDKIKALARVYGTTPQYIMGWDDDIDTKYEIVIASACARLKRSDDPKDRAALAAIHNLLGIEEHGISENER